MKNVITIILLLQTNKVIILAILTKTNKNLSVIIKFNSIIGIENTAGKSNKRLDLVHYTIKCHSRIVLFGAASFTSLFL